MANETMNALAHVNANTASTAAPTSIGRPARSKKRSAEILGVFAAHNFYINGFTPEELRTTLEDLGPTYVKIGQIMSSRTDMLPEAYCKELEKLRSNVKPLDAAVVRQIIETETGKRIEELYLEFRDEPLGSASIAQAHYGVLLDGTRVVTKVQRPLIADMMRSDFVLLNKLAGTLSMTAEESEEGGLVDLKSVLAELEKVTQDELDFRVEAENTRLFRERCIQDDAVVSCPVIIDELTTERMLTMTYVDGYSIAKRERVDEDGYDRVEIAKAIVDNYLHQVLDVGLFHGDPHQGNIMVSKGVPYWIDFGMIGTVSAENIAVLTDVVFALIRRDAEGLANAVLAMGAASPKTDKARLTEEIDRLIERYASVKDLSSLDVGAVMTDLTAAASAHHITMPGEYTMLVRSMVTIEGVLETFCPELNLFDFLMKKMIARAREGFDLRESLMSVIEGFSPLKLAGADLPGALSGLLKSVSKGRIKLNLELSGYDGLLDRLGGMVKTVLLAAFSCVLFSGACRLCTTAIQPAVDGIPVVALIVFAVSVALGLYTVRSLRKKR